MAYEKVKWSFAIDDNIRALFSNGDSTDDVVSKTGISRNSLCYRNKRLKEMGRPPLYDTEEMRQRTIQLIAEKNRQNNQNKKAFTRKVAPDTAWAAINAITPIDYSC